MFFLCCFAFCVVFVFYFIKTSKFTLPDVMLMYERTSIVRKRERKKERKKMTQVKEIQSISNTNRMVKVLLQAREVGGLYCAQMVKKTNYGMSKGSASSPTLVGKHKLMTRPPALKNI